MLLHLSNPLQVEKVKMLRVQARAVSRELVTLLVLRKVLHGLVFFFCRNMSLWIHWCFDSFDQAKKE